MSTTGAKAYLVFGRGVVRRSISGAESAEGARPAGAAVRAGAAGAAGAEARQRGAGRGEPRVRLRARAPLRRGRRRRRGLRRLRPESRSRRRDTFAPRLATRGPHVRTSGGVGAGGRRPRQHGEPPEPSRDTATPLHRYTATPHRGHSHQHKSRSPTLHRHADTLASTSISERASACALPTTNTADNRADRTRTLPPIGERLCANDHSARDTGTLR